MWPSLASALAVSALLAVPGAQGKREHAPRPGVWVDARELAELPTSGPAWNALLSAADARLPTPDIGGRDDNADVLVLAKALVFARTHQRRYADEAARAIVLAMGTEKSGDVLSLARNLPGYVIAAELVGLPPASERTFRAWLGELVERDFDGQSLRKIHERRPNNWGMHAGGARAVVARYLDDQAELERVAQVLRGWLGERDHYAGFEYGALDWQADPARPVGINPRGATRDGHSLDGVLPDDQRRSGGFTWPPPHENYVYEALQGALLQAMVLERAGYDVWSWGDQAFLRAFTWLAHEADFPATGDDTWQPYVINHAYHADLPVVVPARPGKNLGWTDWTLGALPIPAPR